MKILPVRLHVDSLIEVTKKISSKIEEVARACLDAVARAFAFPLRYFGAKQWSIPGIILRTPGIIFRSLFCGKPITKKEFFGSGYQSDLGPRLTPEETKPWMKYAACGLVPFHSQHSWLTPYDCSTVSATEILNNPLFNKAQLPGKIEVVSKRDDDSGKNVECFFDSNTLFKACVMEDDNELVVAFGAMNSHWDNIPKERGSYKLMIHLLSAVGEFVGLNPLVYRQADAFVGEMKKIAAEKGKELVITGQSFAGSLTTYTALKHEVKGVCFNALQIGAGLQRDIGADKLAQANERVTHIAIEGEWLTSLPGIGVVDTAVSLAGFRTPGNFGKRFTVPSAHRSMMLAHDYPYVSLLAHLGIEYGKNKACNSPTTLSEPLKQVLRGSD